MCLHVSTEDVEDLPLSRSIKGADFEKGLTVLSADMHTHVTA